MFTRGKRGSLARRSLVTSVLAAVTATLVASSMTGCAKSSDSGSKSDSVGYGADKPEVTIKFWYLALGSDSQQVMDTQLSYFAKAHPNIKVKATALDRTNALTQLKESGSGSDRPDLAEVNSDWVSTLAQGNILRTITDAEVAALGGQTAFLPASWTSTKLVGRVEKVAVPYYLQVKALFYRTDVLRRLELDPQAAFASWAATEDTLKRIKAEGQLAALGLPGKGDPDLLDNLAPFIWASGGDLVSQDGKTAIVAETAAYNGVDYYQRLVANYNSRDLLDKGQAEASDAFAKGRTAVSIMNPRTAFEYIIKAEQGKLADSPGLQAGWSTVSLPVGPKGRATYLGGSNLAIWKNSSHQSAAYELIRFLTADEAQKRYGAQAGAWPARSGSVEGAEQMAVDTHYKGFLDSLTYGKQYPAIPNWVDAESALRKDFTLLWDNAAQNSAPMNTDQLKSLLSQAKQDLTNAIGRVS